MEICIQAQIDRIVMMQKRTIQFPGGTHAQAVRASARANIGDLVRALDLPPFAAVIVLAGGAAFMQQPAEARLQALFTEGIARAASALDALIIDGGTESGVMALMGQGVAQQGHKPTLLGVAPEGRVSYPGKAGAEEDRGPLDPNHSHFVLVESDEWGGETAMMYKLGQFLDSGYLPRSLYHPCCLQ
jgi:hypothetical protein